MSSNQYPLRDVVFGFFAFVFIVVFNVAFAGVIAMAFFHFVLGIGEFGLVPIAIAGCFMRLLGYGKILALPTQENHTAPVNAANQPVRPRAAMLRVNPTLN